MALGHGVSAQQGVLKVAHSDTLGRLRPCSWRGGSAGLESSLPPHRAPHNKCGECSAVQVSSLLNGEKGKKGHATCPVASGHGVSAQQGVLKVAHSDTLGRLRPRSWRIDIYIPTHIPTYIHQSVSSFMSLILNNIKNLLFSHLL